MDLTTYGEGGFQPQRGDKNIVASKEVAVAPEQTNADTLRTKALQALQENRDFIASTPDAAAVRTHVKKMAAVQNGIIRLLLNEFSGTD